MPTGSAIATRRSARPRAGLVALAGLLGVAAITLSLMVPGTPAPVPASRPLVERPEPTIRVRVRRDLDRLTLPGPGTMRVRQGEHAQSVHRVTLPAQLCAQADHLELTDARERTIRLRPDTPIVLTRPDSEPIELTSGPIGPTLVIRGRTESDRFDAIARVPLEPYIAGVVARELYAGWPVETFKAQAVAARSYALSERADARARGRAYDLDASTRHQGFGGVTSMRIAQRAVDATRSLVLTDRGRLVHAYYSGVCGGRAASARDVWTDPANDLDALDAAARQPWCDHAPLYRWVAVRYEPALRDRLRAWGRARGHPLRRIERLTSIEPVDTNAVGRPVRYRVADETGRRVELTAEQLRIACNTPTSTLASPPARSRVHSGDLAVTIAGDRVELSGRGAGHGVGLCQYGAAAMGRAGYDWRAILETYYPGAAIEPWYR